jgi:enamine deaminase RidA (YjgF/YER057c/UK114 family)
MSDTPEARLAAAGHTLPTPAAPIAAYVPTVQSGNQLFISGQVSQRDGGLITGRVGDDLDIEAGKAAAETCGLYLIAQMKAALGDLSRVKRVVKLGVFVNSTGDFVGQPEVANGASELMQLAFGDKGLHARSAVSAPALPRGVAVEVDAVVEVEG